MKKEHTKDEYSVEEKPDAFWRKVYLAVIVVTVLVISALSLFSWYFA